MADRIKARRNNNTFRRICREEAARGEVVVVATERRAVCTRSMAEMPCLTDIFVLSGLEQPCAVCAPHVQPMREMHGYRQEGKFWITDLITEKQKELIRHRIGQADMRNWVNAENE